MGMGAVLFTETNRFPASCISVGKVESPSKCHSRTSQSRSIDELLETWVEKGRAQRKKAVSLKASSIPIQNMAQSMRRDEEENSLSRILGTLGETEAEKNERQWIAKRRQVPETMPSRERTSHGVKSLTASGKVRVQLDVENVEDRNNSSGPPIDFGESYQDVRVPSMGPDVRLAWTEDDRQVSPGTQRAVIEVKPRERIVAWLSGDSLIESYHNRTGIPC